MPACHLTGVQSSIWLVDASVSGALGIIKKQELCSTKSRDPRANGSHPSLPQIEKSDWKWSNQETHVMPSDDNSVLNLQRPASDFLRVTWQIPSMCERRREASLLVDSVSSKLHHFTPPPSQQTLTLFCDYLASSFPNVHQIKELLGHGRTCLWGRISFKVTAQPELTLLVFIQSM